MVLVFSCLILWEHRHHHCSANIQRHKQFPFHASFPLLTFLSRQYWLRRFRMFFQFFLKHPSLSSSTFIPTPIFIALHTRTKNGYHKKSTILPLIPTLTSKWSGPQLWVTAHPYDSKEMGRTQEGRKHQNSKKHSTHFNRQSLESLTNSTLSVMDAADHWVAN